jgi:hypothetical protein
MIQEIGGSVANQSTGANVPPPPAEVKVRTMRSDVEGVAKTGGGAPEFKMVPVEAADFSKGKTAGGSGHSFPWWVVAVIVVVLAVLLWFGYAMFLKK